jgi:DNA-binding protein Fis
MEEFIPSNLDSIQEVIHRVRSSKNPNMRDSDCQALEKRFYDLDWVTQLDIYELWLEQPNIA